MCSSDLHDKEVHGHPLTDAQRRFFGAMSKGAIKKYREGGDPPDCPEGYFYSEEDDDCIPIGDLQDNMGGYNNFQAPINKRVNTGIGLKDSNYDFNYNFSLNPVTKQDITHRASLFLPELFRVGTNSANLSFNGTYSPNRDIRGNLSLGIPISKNSNRDDRLIITGGGSKNFMYNTPNNKTYNAGIEYSGKMFGDKGPTVRINAGYNQYKRGGGYFPEYHSWAPPRMDEGGGVDCDPGYY